MTALAVTTISGDKVLAEGDGSSFETVGGLKRAIQNRHGTPRYQQRLLLGERTLEEDSVALASLGEPPLRLDLVVLPYQEDDETRRAVVLAMKDLCALERLLRVPANPNGVVLGGTPLRS